MLKYHLLFLFVFTSIFYNAEVLSQDLTYEIIWKDDSIGYLKANRIPSKNFVKYTIKSDVSVSFIAKVDMTYVFENVFSNGVLVKGSSANYVNEKQKSQSLIKWDGKRYSASLDDKEVGVPNRPIKSSMTSLYYKEPKGVTQIFSERFMGFCSISEVAPHKYELVLPNGKKNYYTYKDDVCVLVEVNHAMATFYFKLKNNSGNLVLN